MQGNILNLHTPLTPGVGFNGQLLKLCRCKYTYSSNKALKHTKRGCYDLNETEGELQVKTIEIYVL